MTTPSLDDELLYYAAPGMLTSLPGLDSASLPDDVAGLARIVQGVLVHRAWAPAYRVELAADRLGEEGLHSAEAMAARIRGLDGAEIAVARMPDHRMVSNCRHFATLMCALLRLKGIPARARCGFATYFEAGKYVDHWTCEYWRAGERRWAMVDAQLDGLQQAALKLDFDPLDVPPERFWNACAAWIRCRAGTADPALFGIAHMWGLWYVRGNVLLDMAALSKIELLPWDVPWGVALTPIEDWSADQFALLDRVATLGASAEAGSIAELRRMFANDERIRVPAELLERVATGDRSGGTGANPLAEM